jgi:hypothetical protein
MFANFISCLYVHLGFGTPLAQPSADEQIQREERAMRLVVRKLEIPDLGQLQSLVIEHLDGIEPGLTVLDSRLMLGHATVDIVALDADGTLVLVTAGFTADEDMLLKAVEAYSWCLEYSDAIRRLYPSVDVSAARPPRLMFVVERLPDSFHRKIKQLGFSEVDCVEFRHLDVSGTPAVYFDTLARLRRGSTLAEFQPAPIARRVSEPQMRRAPEPTMAERPVDKLVDHSDKVVPLVTGASGARATSVRLQKMLNTNGVTHGHGGAPVIDIVARTAVSIPRVQTPTPSLEIAAPSAEALRIEAPTRGTETVAAAVEEPTLEIELSHVETVEEEPLELAEDVIEAARAEIPAPAAANAEIAVPELESLSEPEPPVAVVEPPVAVVEPPVAVVEPIARVALREAMAAPAPVAVATPATQNPEPRISFAEIAKELLGALANVPPMSPATGDAAEVTAPSPAAVIKEESAEPVVAAPPVVEKPAPVVVTPPKPVFTAPKPVAPAAKPVAPVIKPIAPATKPTAPAPKPIAPAPRPIVTAPKPAAAVPKPAVAASKPVAPEAAPAPTAATETPAQPLPQEFEGLKFPNDGVLTRQWMEFLNQMASSK